MAQQEQPNNKAVKATIEKGLTGVRVFTAKMPQDVCVYLASSERELNYFCVGLG